MLGAALSVAEIAARFPGAVAPGSLFPTGVTVSPVVGTPVLSKQLAPTGITASPVVGTPALSRNLVPTGITASPVVGQPLLEVDAAGVTALTLDTATGGTGQITYAGTYLPADLSPAPTITITAIRGGSDIATEAADTVSAGSFSGVITVSAGSSTTLRAEALGNSQDTSDPVTVT